MFLELALVSMES